MKDRLESFIRNNREAFDDREAPQSLWQKIESQLPKGRSISLWNSVVVWRVAAMAFMALSIYLLIPQQLKPQRESAMEEFSDVESFYISQISEKIELIDTYQQAEGLNGFTQDFQQLEAMYAVLKEEMKVRPSEKVKDALVLNLLVRIDLLNQQLHELDHAPSPGSKEPRKASS